MRAWLDKLFMLRQGQMCGPIFLKLYVPGEVFVLLHYWPLWNRTWWRLLWSMPKDRRKWHWKWTDITVHHFVRYIAFSLPLWFWLSKTSRCTNRLGHQRGPCLLVFRCAIRVFPFWKRGPRPSPWAWKELVVYPLRDRQEYLGDPFDFFATGRLDWMEDVR